MSARPADGLEAWTDEQVADSRWEVRRRPGPAALIGTAAAAVALAFLWRAVLTGSVLDAAVCAVVTAVAAYHLAAFVDARTPLVVADELGVRLRFGAYWRGLPWSSLERVVVLPARSRLREDRLVLVPRDLDRALEGLDRRARRQVRLTDLWYGAPFAVPLGAAVRISGTAPEPTPHLALAALADGRVPVELLTADPTGPVETASVTGSGETPATPAPSPTREPARPTAGVAPVPLRPTQSAVRAEVVTTPTWGATALAPESRSSEEERDGSTIDRLPEGRALRRPGSVDLFVDETPAFGPAVVSPLATPGQPVAPIVIDDLAEPAYDPVIGPDLAAARTRLGLSIDDLADRTRIRPHVLEALEVDDFAPCGGDVYARGHLRTVGRVLGLDGDALVARFDERYAQAPIDARRVFEAELATGMTGSMRRTSGGPNWLLMAAAVVSLALVWGVARLVAGDPATEMEIPSIQDSAGLTGGTSAPVPPQQSERAATRTVRVQLTATADSRVLVRDRAGRVVFRGPMVLGERKRLDVVPPLRVRAAVPGVVEVSVRGRDRGLVGSPAPAGAPAAPAVGTFR